MSNYENLNALYRYGGGIPAYPGHINWSTVAIYSLAGLGAATIIGLSIYFAVRNNNELIMLRIDQSFQEHLAATKALQQSLDELHAKQNSAEKVKSNS